MKALPSEPPAAAPRSRPARRPSAAVARRRHDRADEARRRPPTAATTPRTAGLMPRSSSTNRNQIAPKTPHIAASDIWAKTKARRIGSWRTSRRPPGSRPGPARGPSGCGGGGSWLADRSPSSSAETRIGDRVDRDGDRGGQELDQETADAEGHELGDRAAGRQRAVGVDQPLAFDDRRQVGVVRRVEERGQDRRQPGHDEQLRERQDTERERDRDRARAARPARDPPR